MEVIHSLGTFRWGHETTQGIRQTAPEPDTLVPLLDDDGKEVVDGGGNVVLVPPADWQPELEQVELDTVVIIDSSSDEIVNVFKLSLDKQGLARFIAYYTQFLDQDGTATVRGALSELSGITIASPSDIRKLEIVK